MAYGIKDLVLILLHHTNLSSWNKPTHFTISSIMLHTFGHVVYVFIALYFAIFQYICYFYFVSSHQLTVLTM